jgi:hypothetical protein
MQTIRQLADACLLQKIEEESPTAPVLCAGTPK